MLFDVFYKLSGMSSWRSGFILHTLSLTKKQLCHDSGVSISNFSGHILERCMKKVDGNCIFDIFQISSEVVKI